jgi:hypothetical protein
MGCRRLRLQGIRLGLPQPGATAHPDQAVHTQNQRKAERFIQTLCREWAYVMAFSNPEDRNLWLPRDLALSSGAAR